MSERFRVYELARELGMTSAEMLDFMHEEGIEVSSHSSTVDGDTAELVRDHIMTARAKARRGSGEGIDDSETAEEESGGEVPEDTEEVGDVDEEDEDEDEVEALGEKEIT